MRKSQVGFLGCVSFHIFAQNHLKDFELLIGAFGSKNNKRRAVFVATIALTFLTKNLQKAELSCQK